MGKMGEKRKKNEEKVGGEARTERGRNRMRKWENIFMHTYDSIAIPCGLLAL